MKERPILFSAPMVRAILDDSKTQTRRVVKPPKGWPQYSHCDPFAMPPSAWWWNGEHECAGVRQDCPYGQPGDRLWVKETWRPKIAHSHGMDACDCADVWVDYTAGGEGRYFSERDIPEEWMLPKAARGNVSPLFMPRWASRILLEVASVRVERLQDISDADARAEGVLFVPGHGEISAADLHADPGYSNFLNCPMGFESLWESINGPGSWDANPWVWVVEFKRITGNPDNAG